MSMFPNAWMAQPHTIAMDLPKMLPRQVLAARDEKTGGLGLGWLITIAVLGGVLLFACVGYLLAWKIRQRSRPVTRRVYATDPASDHHEPDALTTVLSKRRLLNSQTTMQILPSEASELTLGFGYGEARDPVPWRPPPVLPPLPKSRSFGLNIDRFRGRWSVDGESEHGPERRRWSWRDSWVGVMMGSGALATATLPDLEDNAPQPAPTEAPQELKDMSPERNEIHVQKKRQSRPPAMGPAISGGANATLGGSATAPELRDAEEERGRSRVAGQMRYVKPSGTASDLKDILAHTEQRLRDGTSRSPVKTPRGSPTKNGSPMKTPRTGSSTRTRGRVTPSPSKKSQNNTPGTNKSRGPSVSSIGSAANSLIQAATQELQLPGGTGSPSRLRAGQEWSSNAQVQLQPAQSTSPQRSPPRPSPRRRSRSLDSDVSSALSTLYSVGEPEDEQYQAPQPNATRDDPFVETRQGPTGPRPLERAQTVREGKVRGEVVDETAVPAPLRTLSTNARFGGRRGSLKMTPAPVLSPPRRRDSVETKAKNDLFIGGQRSVSEGSESVYTDVTVPESEEEGETTPKGVKQVDSTSNVATPTRARLARAETADLTSSPLDEREVMSLRHQSSQMRGLPKPPTRILLNDEMILPTPLSPRPKNQYQRPPTRRASIASTSSSNYDQDFNNEDYDVATSLPGRRATTSGLHSVGSTVAELRRMNSVVSSYSVASIASTAGGDKDEGESPTLPVLRGGGFSPDRAQSKTVKDGKKNYLNVGSSQGSLRATPRRGHSRNNSRPTNSLNTPKDTREPKSLQKGEEEKENQGHGLRVRFELPSPRRSPNGPRKAMRSPTRLPLRSDLKDGDKEKERKRRQRESAESLGLYDQDGFLKSSPDRDAVAKGGRLRM